MKKIIFLLLVLILFFTNTYAKEMLLTDIENHWANENIKRLIINGKINGYPDNTFKPNNNVTIIEFIKIMIDTLDIKLVKDDLIDWPNNYINTAQSLELNYQYDKYLTRYEATEIISKLIDIKSESKSNNKFKDLNSKNKSAVLKLTNLKIINGYVDNTFRGDNYLTRAEAVTIALRTLEANQKIIKDKKYKIESKYTNINEFNNNLGKIKYEIKKDKLYFTDKGRFSEIEDYTIEEKYVGSKKIIKLIESLISEKSYTAVYYVPSKYIINQIIIKYGENDDIVNRNLEYFSLTYFEDKLYDLNRIALKDEFSNECYLKINLKKMWKELYQFENRNYTDENIKERLLKALKIEFNGDAEKIMEYMLKEYEESVLSKEEIIKQVKINNYLINTYKTDSSSLEFYFEKI